MEKNKVKPAPPEEKKDKIRFGIRAKFSLSIISLVFFIVLTITGYIVIREGNLLKDQIFQLINRELVHLGNSAFRNINIDDLAVTSSVNDLKKIPYVRYTIVLDRVDLIHTYFDNRGERTVKEKLNDSVLRKQNGPKDTGAVVVDYDDPLDPDGSIYDFSKTVFNQDGVKFATVIIGISDIVVREAQRNLLLTILPIFAAFMLISIAGSVILASFIIKPIKKLSEGAAVIGSGNLDFRIDITSSDELGRLAGEFNQMTLLIKSAKDKEIESRLLEEQMEMAKDIQEGLNPMGFYDKAGVQIKGFTRAAKGVGGDYFDYIEIDENRVGALISDVAGKGVPASLVMVMIRTVFTSYVTRDDIDCAAVLTAINDSLSADFAIDKFATLFFVIYDRSTEELTFANAGHAPLFCYRAKNNACTFAKLDGVPIGIMEDVDYTQSKVKLEPGDIVFMFSDGITEMRNAAKDEYGFKRVVDFIVENNALNAKELVDKLVIDVDDFRGDVPPHDDMTLLFLKRSE
jgi:sigma-B regulation protein RsbU (phosphoserine phosphatase)